VSEGGDSSGSQSIDRAARLLALVAERHRQGAALTELVRESGLNQATARRILVALIRSGLIEQSEATRRYHLGVATYVYGTIASDRFAYQALGDESVRRLAELSEDTAFFCVRQGLHTLCLRREEGLHPIRAQVLNVGQRHPLGVAAHGIAILASLPDAEIDAVVDSNLDYYASHYPMLTEDLLREMLAEARWRGVAINRGVFHRGAWAIAIPIRGLSGEVMGALSVGAVEDRLGETRQPDIIRYLKVEAKKLETRIATFGTHMIPAAEAAPRAIPAASPKLARRRQSEP
jgi:DNA-binding IclR family transcriptional regulator